MPTKKGTPPEVQAQVHEAVARFNRSLAGRGVSYEVRFRGAFVYLDRGPAGRAGPMCRLTYTVPGGKWGFAIYKYSSGTYDPREWMFPGSEHLNGTIEGALKAATAAYPP